MPREGERTTHCLLCKNAVGLSRTKLFGLAGKEKHIREVVSLLGSLPAKCTFARDTELHNTVLGKNDIQFDI